MKKQIFVVLTIATIAFASMTFSAFAESANYWEGRTSAPDGSDKVYTIGLAAMLTGDNALNGQRMQGAAEMAISEYNEDAGYERFVLDATDDLTTDEGALTAMQKLISDGCSAVIGPHRSSAALAVSDTNASSKVACLVGGTSVAIDGSNPYMFRTRASDAIMANVAINYAINEMKGTKVGILHASDTYGQGGADVAIKNFKANGIEYVDEPHNVNDVDFTSAILECQSTGCDTIFVWTHDAEMAIIAQQLATYMPDVPVIGSPGATLKNVLDLCEDEWVDGWYSVTDFISTTDDEVGKSFVERYENMHNDTPDLYAAAYYGGTVTVLDAINKAEEAGEDVTPQVVRDYIAKTDGLVLPTGTFSNNATNDLVHDCVIAHLNGKTPEFVSLVTE